MEWETEMVSGVEKVHDLTGKAATYLEQKLHAGATYVKNIGVVDADALLEEYSAFAKGTIAERDKMKYSANENGRAELQQLMNIHELVEATLRQKETTRQSAPRFSGDAIDAGMGEVETKVNQAIKDEGVVAGIELLKQQVPDLVHDANYTAAEYRHMEMRKQVESATYFSAEEEHLKVQEHSLER